MHILFKNANYPNNKRYSTNKPYRSEYNTKKKKTYYLWDKNPPS